MPTNSSTSNSTEPDPTIPRIRWLCRILSSSTQTHQSRAWERHRPRQMASKSAIPFQTEAHTRPEERYTHLRLSGNHQWLSPGGARLWYHLDTCNTGVRGWVGVVRSWRLDWPWGARNFSRKLLVSWAYSSRHCWRIILNSCRIAECSTYSGRTKSGVDYYTCRFTGNDWRRGDDTCLNHFTVH